MKMQRSLLFGGVEISAARFEAEKYCKFANKAVVYFPASPDR